jgi:hypothetical protein
MKHVLVQDSLIVCTTQVAEYVECGIHVSLSRVLYVLAELRVRPSEIWSGHIDKIAQASDYLVAKERIIIIENLARSITSPSQP